MTRKKWAEFGDWLYASMGGRSVASLAEAVGVQRSTVNTWVNGTARPAYENSEPLARALNLDPRLVRRMAGYAADGDPAIDVTPSWLLELKAIGEALDEGRMDSLLEVARGLRRSQERSNRPAPEAVVPPVPQSTRG
jgi:transcriptional regulator with XRE-family HTH domain